MTGYYNSSTARDYNSQFANYMPIDIMCHKKDILYARASLIRHIM